MINIPSNLYHHELISTDKLMKCGIAATQMNLEMVFQYVHLADSSFLDLDTVIGVMNFIANRITWFKSNTNNDNIIGYN